MPRKPRIQYAGAVYHPPSLRLRRDRSAFAKATARQVRLRQGYGVTGVMNRGDRRRLFRDRVDYQLMMGTASQLSTYISRAKSTRIKTLRRKAEKGIRK